MGYPEHVFADIFRWLAKEPKSRTRDRYVAAIWTMVQKGNYGDFNEGDLEIDDILIKLGLAKMVPDPDGLPGDEMIVYANANGALPKRPRL